MEGEAYTSGRERDREGLLKESILSVPGCSGSTGGTRCCGPPRHRPRRSAVVLSCGRFRLEEPGWVTALPDGLALHRQQPGDPLPRRTGQGGPLPRAWNAEVERQPREIEGGDRAHRPFAADRQFVADQFYESPVPEDEASDGGTP